MCTVTANGTEARGMMGYGSEQYAESLAEFGEPLRLSGCGGWLLRRRIPGSDRCDAMGPYPLFSCENWGALRDDLRAQNGLVAASLVTDPLGDYDEPALNSAFERVLRFKQHVVYDLSKPREEAVSSGHRSKARKALRSVDVRFEEDPAFYCDEWTALYGELIQRHALVGIKAFSRSSFDRQLRIPGAVLARAMVGERCVSAAIWLRGRDAVYYHLGASTEEGYEHRAAYAIFWEAIARFSSQAAWMVIGAGAGSGTASAGLAQFKKGWSDLERWSYFCGVRLRPTEYDELLVTEASRQTAYFPAYRVGEF